MVHFFTIGNWMFHRFLDHSFTVHHVSTICLSFRPLVHVDSGKQPVRTDNLEGTEASPKAP